MARRSIVLPAAAVAAVAAGAAVAVLYAGRGSVAARAGRVLRDRLAGDPVVQDAQAVAFRHVAVPVAVALAVLLVALAVLVRELLPDPAD